MRCHEGTRYAAWYDSGCERGVAVRQFSPSITMPPSPMTNILAICAGASFGALLRWALGLRLNSLFLPLPLGTLCANLLGGYLIGLIVAALAQHATLPPEWRLFLVTGFLGGLTTFSTFSAEVVEMLQQGRFGWAVATILVHVAGSLLMTLLGLYTWQWLRSFA